MRFCTVRMPLPQCRLSNPQGFLVIDLSFDKLCFFFSNFVFIILRTILHSYFLSQLHQCLAAWLSVLGRKIQIFLYVENYTYINLTSTGPPLNKSKFHVASEVSAYFLSQSLMSIKTWKLGLSTNYCLTTKREPYFVQYCGGRKKILMALFKFPSPLCCHNKILLEHIYYLIWQVLQRNCKSRNSTKRW